MPNTRDDTISVDDFAEVAFSGDYNDLINTPTGGGLSLLDVYPVGSVYISVSSTNPGTLFGGTWEQLQNRFLLGAGSLYSAGSTGGEATHKLTINEMPSHSHQTYFRYSDGAGGGNWNYFDPGSNYAANTTSVGGSQPHNNMPPYLVVYMWKRTA